MLVVLVVSGLQRSTPSESLPVLGQRRETKGVSGRDDRRDGCFDGPFGVRTVKETLERS